MWGVYVERIKTEKELIYIDVIESGREVSEATSAVETVTIDRDDLVNARILRAREAYLRRDYSGRQSLRTQHYFHLGDEKRNTAL